MRSALILAPLLLGAAPALAQPAPAPAPAIAVPQQMQQMMSDPATVDRLTGAMQALSKAFLSLPVGEAQAALEGRQPSDADRRRTIGTESGISERELRTRLAAAKPMLQQSMRALADALPAMMQGMAQAQQSIERAAANMPDPNYPKR